MKRHPFFRNLVLIRLLFLYLFALTTGLTSALHADSFGIRLGYWSTPGSSFFRSDLENRFFMDDLLKGSGDFGVQASQWNLPWSSMKRYAYPLELYYTPGRSRNFRFEAGGDSTKSSVTGNGFIFSRDQIQFMTLDRYRGWKLQEYYAGAALYLLNPEVDRQTVPVVFLVRGGGIRSDRSFGFDSLLVGDTGIGLKKADEPWSSRAGGLYYGAELGYLIDRAHLTIYGRHDRSDALRGKFSYGYYTVAMARNGDISRISQDRMGGDVRMDRRLYEGGIRYHVTRDFSLTLAYRKEEFRTSYPNYSGYTIDLTRTGNGNDVKANLSISEFLMDTFLVYGERKLESRGGVLFSLEKRFDF